MTDSQDILSDVVGRFWHGATLAPNAVLIIGTVTLFLGVKFFQARRARLRVPKFGSLKPIALLSDDERAFFIKFADALPSVVVLAKVSFRSLLDLSSREIGGKTFEGTQDIGSEIADFVLCRKDSFEIIAVVELAQKAGASRSRERQLLRDAALHAANYRVEIFSKEDGLSSEDIQKRFRTEIGQA